MLDVMGTETNWNPGGRWRPMSDAELLYRRAMCKGKPYCFLMNTDFEKFSPRAGREVHEAVAGLRHVPRLLQPQRLARATTSPGPSSTTATGRCSSKYVPLCKLVAEAGWEPITQARSSDEHVYVERFGDAVPDRLQRQPRAAHGHDHARRPRARGDRAASWSAAGTLDMARRQGARSRSTARTWR